METLARRLDMCQEQLLELYEKDSRDLQDHVLHWKCIRYECALYYKAREMGIKHLGHQVVPKLEVSRAKAHVAIEMQLSLESLLQTEYSIEPWTLQDTCQELWHTEPKKCFKKRGQTVEVRFDCNPENTMQYTLWSEIYVPVNDTWVKVHGHVDYKGLSYTVCGQKTYYVDFIKEAQTYGDTGQWNVVVGSNVISSPASVSSTVTEVSSVASTEPDSRTATTVPDSTCTQKDYEEQAPPRKRVRFEPHTTQIPCTLARTVGGEPLDSRDPRIIPKHSHHNQGGHSGGSNATPIVQLQGDANSLKCFRYRLGKYKYLYVDVSSTWRWTTESNKQNSALITLTYASVQQREAFLANVKIPTTIKHCLGFLTIM